MEKEYKSLPFEQKQFSEDEKFYYLKAIVSTYGADLEKDKISPGAFQESLQTRKPKFLWGHELKIPPIGKSLLEEERTEGLYIEAHLPKKDTFVTGRIAPQLEIKAIDELSIGFAVNDYEYKDDLRLIHKLTLFEYSLVNIGMNPSTQIVGFKALSRFKNLPLADRNQKWSRKEAVKRIREHTKSTEKPSRSYRSYFMWFDSENSEDFGAYKLPYADWIDGEFKAVPRALIAIKAAIGGARGGVDIPASDKPKILAHVERYLSKLEDAEKIFILSDVKDIETREDFNMLLKDIGLFSKPAREKLSSFLPGPGNSEPTKDIFGKLTKALEEITMRKS